MQLLCTVHYQTYMLFPEQVQDALPVFHSLLLRIEGALSNKIILKIKTSSFLIISRIQGFMEFRESKEHSGLDSKTE